VVESLLKQIQCDLPESLVHDETRSVVFNIVSENQRRGVPKDVMDAQKEQIYASANATAKDRVKASFIFQKIAEKEGVRVSQAEIANRLQLMAAQYKMPAEKLVKELEKRDGLGEVYQQILSEKVVDLLVLNAKIEDITVVPQA
jgi:trigger factor